MIKMKSKNRPGGWKLFNESDVEEAKKLGWTLFDEKPKSKSKKSKSK